jgi:opacity protein-like surface antigen
MNSSCLRLVSAVALATAAVQSAHAADENESPWSLSVLGGSAVGFTGSLRTPEITSIPDLGNLDPGLAQSPGSVTLNNVLYDDIFRHRHDVGFELGYAFSPNVEGFGRLTYEGLAGQTTTIGSLSSEALPSPEPLVADFDDAHSWSLELGSRYYWPTGSPWRPFADVALGATRMDALTASLEVPDTAIDLQDVRFTNADTVFTQSVGGGIEYAPSRNFGMLFAANAEHMGSLPESNDPALLALGIDTAHDSGDRWSFPLTLSASYRFGRG